MSTLTNTIGLILGGVAVIAFISVVATPILYHTGVINKNIADPMCGVSFLAVFVGAIGHEAIHAFTENKPDNTRIAR